MDCCQISRHCVPCKFERWSAQHMLHRCLDISSHLTSTRLTLRGNDIVSHRRAGKGGLCRDKVSSYAPLVNVYIGGKSVGRFAPNTKKNMGPSRRLHIHRVARFQHCCQTNCCIRLDRSIDVSSPICDLPDPRWFYLLYFCRYATVHNIHRGAYVFARVIREEPAGGGAISIGPRGTYTLARFRYDASTLPQ